jgi:hypothetical protein
MPLFSDIFFTYRYSIEIDEEQIYRQYFAWGLLGVLSAGCGLLAWMHWSFIGEFVVGFKSVEELYPSPPLGVESAQGEEFAWKIPILSNNPAGCRIRVPVPELDSREGVRRCLA